MCHVTVGHVAVGHVAVGHVTVGHVTVGHVAVGHVAVSHVTLCYVTVCHATLGHFTVGHVTVGHVALGLVAVGHVTVGHVAVGHIAVGHVTVGHVAVGHVAVGHGTLCYVTVCHATVGHVAVSHVTLCYVTVCHATLGHVTVGHIAVGHVAVGHVAVGHGTLCYVTVCHATVGHVTVSHVTVGHIAVGHVSVGHVAVGHVAVGHVTVCHATTSPLFPPRIRRGGPVLCVLHRRKRVENASALNVVVVLSLCWRIVSTNFIPDRSRPGLTTTTIGAVDLQGAGGNWATVGRRSRGGRRVHRQREKRKGKGRELADMMERRKVDILCVQETRWKGSKAHSIGAGFKLFYYGVDSKRNGVGVVLKEEFVRNVLEVGCELEEKERFWSELDEVMESIPTGDEEVMGKFGVKERNLEGQMVVDFAKRMDMGVVNTYFQKREEHRVTYKSGGRSTQKKRQKLRQALGGQVLLPDDWETTAEDSIQRKRFAKKKWDMDRTEENRQECKELQRRVRREVSKAKQKAYDELYTRLDTREGEKDLYRVLTSEESVQRRWKEYFEELMNEENEREKRVEGVNSVEQEVDKIRKDEVRKGLKRMKSGKAVGPDDIPVEVWKCLGEAAVEFLANLFNRVLENLEKAYDRVPREELWYCMRKSGAAEKYVRVVQDMYERSRTVVRCAVGQTEEFNVEVGLHQGSALSPFLFAIVMDQLSEEVRQESPWTMMFADDIVICSESREQVEENLERWRFALERRGMKVSRSKTEYMCVNEREGSGTVRLQGEEVKKVQEFKYLGSTVQSNGECGKEVKKRVQAEGVTQALEPSPRQTSELNEAELGGGVMSEAELGDGVMSEAELGDGVMSEAELGDGVMSEAELGDGVMSEAELGGGVMSETELGDGVMLFPSGVSTANHLSPPIPIFCNLNTCTH
ncbi:hypothetical protein QTP86_011012 [Hemibagrus guttatus]|nr:hypothetical protein QTP86_011012 [Hemibagrus guttatus]